MLTSYQLGVILKDEKLTQGLPDPDGRCLVERLVYLADSLESKESGPQLAAKLTQLSKRGRLVARIVALWISGNKTSAIQLAASGGLGRFIPAPNVSEEALIHALLPT
jgi:hypothetical protein